MFNAFTPKQKISIWALIGLFTLLFCSVSLVNHYYYRTYAYDLGIYNNILYSYSHFSLNHTSIQQPLIYHAFADHFEPIFFLFAPFYWVFGSYTLLLIQIAAIVLGGIGAMLYVKEFTQNNKLAIACMAQFYAMWGVYSALSFDFHNNVTAAMLVPWLMLYVHKQQWKAAALFFALMLISKENMALYTIFVCLGLAWHYVKTPIIRNRMLGFAGIAAVYFVLVVKVIVPAFQPGDSIYLYESHYHYLGTNMADMLRNIFLNPGRVFALLFENPTAEPFYNGIKSELHFSVLVCGGIFLFYKPQFLVMLISIYSQKLFIYDATRWGINNHYSIEFVPVIAIGTAMFIHELQPGVLKKYLPLIMVLVTFSYTINKMDDRKSIWYNKVNSRFFTPDHYKAPVAISELNKAMAELPLQSTDAVSAQSPLVSRLCNRNQIYLYPKVSEANYIILSPKLSCFPINDSILQANIDTLLKSNTWQLIQNKNELVVFKRK